MEGRSGENGDSNSSERTRQSEREEGRPSLVCLAFMRLATVPANAASIDLKDWRRVVYEGLLFEDNKKKFWVHGKLHKNCLLVLPKATDIEEGDECWRWIQEKEKCFGGVVDIAVPELVKKSWLIIKGSFSTDALSPKTTYEVAFVVKLRRSSNIWPLPVNFELYLPDGSALSCAESLERKPKEKWIKLRVGKFVTHPKNMGKIRFVFHEKCQIYKSGLVFKGLLVHPKD